MPRLRLKLTCYLVLFAIPLAAQPHTMHEEPSLSTGLWRAPVDLQRPTVHQTPAGKISAELLAYPLSNKALQMLRKALEISKAGDHARAIQQLQKTLAKYPSAGAYVYSLLGVEYLKTVQIQEAVDALERSVKLLPHDASNHANLGLAFLAKGESDRAQSELRRALDLDPHYAMASQLLGGLALRENAQK